MPRLLTASPTLVLQRGQPALASPYLALEGCARISAPGSETIALVLEPVEESPRARQVAQDLAERLIEEIQARRGQTTTAALLAATACAAQ